MSLRRLKWAAGGVGALCLLLTGVFAVLVVILPLPERLRLRDSTVVHYDDGRPAHVFLGSDERYRLFVAPNDVDPRYVDALIRFEDKRFYAHHGVDFVAVMRAAWTNVTRGRVVSGASTLTMQVVRLLEPRPRTLRSKAVEAFRAVQLEFYLSKEEILAAYLRFVPLGGNLEGIGAASLAYFGHDVKSLSPAEIVTLLAVPQNPNRRQPKPQNRARLRGAVDTIAKRLTEAGVFTEDERKRITASALVQNLRGLPKNTPHLAFWAKSSRPKASAIRTTVRADVQSLAEQILAGHRSALARRGIHNAAVVVIDVEASAVRAVIGNFDFFDRAHAGQIPGFARRRSPGSALKPFLYGLGIDRGVVLPEHLVEDAPVRFGNYAPKNYDGRFRGVVRFSDALSASLNVPFVNLLRDVTVAQFVDFLQQGGVDVAEPDRYGLSLAIGGIELTPLEVTNLYAALARGGMYEDAALLHGTKSTPARPWLSPGAAFLTRRALAKKDRPDFPHRRERVALAPRIFWKTGTSYGHRDAWAVGANDRYAVGVWLGNFDNTPSRSLVGATRAGPILFDVLDALTDRAMIAEPESVPDDLVEVAVCALSGRVLTSACAQRSTALALKTEVPTASCPFHHRFEIDRETGHALCPMCRHGRTTTVKNVAVLPNSLRSFVTDAAWGDDEVPSHLPICPEVLARTPPIIIEPQRGTELFLVPGMSPARQEIPLVVRTDSREQEVFWFVDGRLHARTSANAPAWLAPREGRMEIKVLDSTGRSASVTIKVHALL